MRGKRRANAGPFTRDDKQGRLPHGMDAIGLKWLEIMSQFKKK